MKLPKRVGLAALCAAGTMACAGRAGAAITLYDNNDPTHTFSGSGSGLSTFTYASGPSASVLVICLEDCASALPEPATWALMLSGFVGLGAALRRRRRTLAAAELPGHAERVLA
jgi:hypothetical protein